MNKYIKYVFLIFTLSCVISTTYCMMLSHDVTLNLQDGYKKFTQDFPANTEIDSSLLWGNRVKSCSFMDLIVKLRVLINSNIDACKQYKSEVLELFTTSFISALLAKIEFMLQAINDDNISNTEIDSEAVLQNIKNTLFNIEQSLHHDLTYCVKNTCAIDAYHTVIIGNLVKSRPLSLFMNLQAIKTLNQEQETIKAHCAKYIELPITQQIAKKAFNKTANSIQPNIEITSNITCSSNNSNDPVVFNIKTTITSPKKSNKGRFSLEQNQILQISQMATQENDEPDAKRKCIESRLVEEYSSQTILLALRFAQRIERLSNRLNQSFDKTAYYHKIKDFNRSSVFELLPDLNEFLDRETNNITQENAAIFLQIYEFLVYSFFNLGDFKLEVLKDTLKGNYAIVFDVIKEFKK